jgi:hypothetical protein
MKTFRLRQMITRCIIGCAVVTACHSPAVAGTLNFFSPYEWSSAACTGPNCTWTAASPFGAVTAFSNNGWAPAGSGGTDFTPPLTNEFNANSVGASLVTTLPSGLNWGTTGGELILGNIHNFFEYNLSATDTLGSPINVNAWTILGEDLNSTSSTATCIGGSSVSVLPGGVCVGASSSEGFYVYDTGASTGSGQGGVVALGNLPSNLGTITLTLASNNLGNMFPTGGQGSDYIVFNVGEATPEPSSAVLIGTGAVGMLVLLRRRRRGRMA